MPPPAKQTTVETTTAAPKPANRDLLKAVQRELGSEVTRTIIENLQAKLEYREIGGSENDEELIAERIKGIVDAFTGISLTLIRDHFDDQKLFNKVRAALVKKGVIQEKTNGRATTLFPATAEEETVTA